MWNSYDQQPAEKSAGRPAALPANQPPSQTDFLRDRSVKRELLQELSQSHAQGAPVPLEELLARWPTDPAPTATWPASCMRIIAGASRAANARASPSTSSDFRRRTSRCWRICGARASCVRCASPAPNRRRWRCRPLATKCSAFGCGMSWAAARLPASFSLSRLTWPAGRWCSRSPPPTARSRRRSPGCSTRTSYRFIRTTRTAPRACASCACRSLAGPACRACSAPSGSRRASPRAALSLYGRWHQYRRRRWPSSDGRRPSAPRTPKAFHLPPSRPLLRR